MKSSNREIVRYCILWGLFALVWVLSIPFRPLLFVLVGLIALASYISVKNRSLVIIVFLILSILFQNTILGLSCHLFGLNGSELDSLSIFSQVPFIIICVASLISAIMVNVGNKFLKWFLLYVVIICAYIVYGKVANLTLILYNVRNFIGFALVFLIGKACINTKDKFLSMADFYVNLAMLAGIVGCILMIGGADLYNALGVNELYYIKSNGQLDTCGFRNGLPGNFYGEFFGVYYTRLASFYLEPVNFSYFMSCSVILRYCKKRTIFDLKLLILLLFEMLTFGKGGLLTLTITIMCLAFKKLCLSNSEKHRRFLRIFAILNIVAFGIVYAKLSPDNYHFYTIKVTFYELINNPLGTGVGTVGNVNSAMTEAIGVETGLLNFWCQIGVFGLIVFILLNLYISKRADQISDIYGCVFSVLPIVLLCVFVFQENTYTIQCITPYMLFCGFFANMKSREQKEIRKCKLCMA